MIMLTATRGLHPIPRRIMRGVLVNSTAKSGLIPCLRGRGATGRLLLLVFSDDTLVRGVVLHCTSQSPTRPPLSSSTHTRHSSEATRCGRGASGTPRLYCLAATVSTAVALKYSATERSAGTGICPDFSAQHALLLGTICVWTLEAV